MPIKLIFRFLLPLLIRALPWLISTIGNWLHHRNAAKRDTTLGRGNKIVAGTPGYGPHPGAPIPDGFGSLAQSLAGTRPLLPPSFVAIDIMVDGMPHRHEMLVLTGAGRYGGRGSFGLQCIDMTGKYAKRLRLEQERIIRMTCLMTGQSWQDTTLQKQLAGLWLVYEQYLSATPPVNAPDPRPAPDLPDPASAEQLCALFRPILARLAAPGLDNLSLIRLLHMFEALRARPDMVFALRKDVDAALQTGAADQDRLRLLVHQMLDRIEALRQEKFASNNRSAKAMLHQLEMADQRHLRTVTMPASASRSGHRREPPVEFTYKSHGFTSALGRVYSLTAETAAGIGAPFPPGWQLALKFRDDKPDIPFALIMRFYESDSGRPLLRLRELSGGNNIISVHDFDDLAEMTCLQTGRVYCGATQIIPALLLLQMIRNNGPEIAGLLGLNATAASPVAAAIPPPLPAEQDATPVATPVPIDPPASDATLDESQTRMLICLAMLDREISAEDITQIAFLSQREPAEIRRIAAEISADALSPIMRFNALLDQLGRDKPRLIWLRYNARNIFTADRDLAAIEQRALDAINRRIEQADH